MTLLPKRPQFAENLRLNSERVNARNFLIGEALKDCTIISRKSKNHVFCFCTLHRVGGVTEEGETAAFL